MTDLSVSPDVDNEDEEPYFVIRRVGLASEALTCFNDFAKENGERPWSMRTFSSRMRTDSHLKPYTEGRAYAGELLAITRWFGAIHPAAKPVPPSPELLLGFCYRGPGPGAVATAPEPEGYPGPHEEFVIDLEAVREFLRNEMAGENGAVSQLDVGFAVYSCLMVLSHPRGWYPPPAVTSTANLRAVVDRAYQIIWAEICGHSGATTPEPAWSATAWLSECTTPDPKEGMRTAELYAHYAETYCPKRGIEPVTQTAWGRTLSEAGFPSVKARGGKRRALRLV
jgi:hypothetical protein